MKRSTIHILFLFLFSIKGLCSFAQVKTDSLLNLIELSTDSTKLIILNELIDEYLPVSQAKSLEYAFQSLEIANLNDNQIWISDAYTKIGQIYYHLEMFPEALDYYLKKEKVSLELQDTSNILRSFRDIGQVYLKLGDTHNSLQYLTKAIELNSQINDTLLLGILKMDIADFYLSTSQDNEAFKYYNESLILLENSGDSQNLINVLSALGDLKRKAEEPFSARILYYRAMQIASKNEILFEQAQLAYKVGMVFMDEKNTLLASSHLLLALGISNEKGFLELSVKINNALSQLSEMEGKYRQALRYQTVHGELKDSLRKTSQQQYLSFLNMKYDSDRKNHELTLLSKTNEINLALLEKQNRIRKFIFVGLIILSFFALISAGFYYYNKRMSVLLANKKKKLEEAHSDLLQSEKELKNLNDTKNKIFSILAHDLINPFNALLGFASLLEEESQYLNKEEVKQYSSIIHKTATNLHQLLENLLQWSKSQTGKIVTKNEFIDINNIVKKVLDFVTISAKTKNIIIKTSLSNSCVAYIDKNLISSALRNIVQNAIKFSSEENEITIRTHCSDKKAIIEVSDKGIGISLKDQKKMFRTDTHFSTRGTSNEQGTGLGLIIANEFVNLNGGKLEMKSKLGKGSTFTISIPKENL